MKTRTIGIGLMWLATACYTGPDGEDPMDDGAGDGADGGESGDGGDGADGVGDGADDGADDGPGDDGADDGDDGPPPPPSGCQAGAIGCECLDGACSGISACVDNVCTPAPPTPETGGGGSAVAGIRIILPGEVDGDDDVIPYDTLEWTQIEGPDATIEYANEEEAVAYLPTNADPETELVFRLTAVLGEVSASADYTVTILPDTPEEQLAEVPDVTMVAGAAVAEAGNGAFWVGNAAGTFARLGGEGMELSVESGSPIAALSGYADNRILLAQPDLQQVSQFNVNNNEITPFVDQLSGGAPLGSATTLIVDGDDNVYMGTSEGSLVFYDSPDGAEPSTTVVMNTMTGTPTALALGQVPVAPDADDGDEGVVLYIGTAAGDVVQVGLTEAEVVGEGPEIGAVTAYVDVPGSGPVTGLTVDPRGNMWVGKASNLYLVRRAPSQAPEVVRTLAPADGLAGHHNLRNDDELLLWIDAATGRIARWRTYNG